MSVGVLGIIIWLIYRAVADSRGAGDTKGRGNLGLVLAIVVWVLLGGTMVVWATQLRHGELAALPKLLVGLVVLFPWPTLRLVLLPLGLLRTAYYLSFLCLVRFQDDRRGGALLVAAWALLRAPQRSEAASAPALQFLEKRLHRLKKMRGAAVVAMGLGAARRGDLEAARALLESTFNLDPAACPRWALELAGEWLSVDAVAQGDWAAVSAQASSHRPRSPLTRLLRACADRFVTTDEPTLVPPSELTLFWRWLRAPHHRATWPLLQRARRSQPLPPPPAPAASAPSATPGTELPAALRELAGLLAAPSITLTQEQVLRVCRSFDAALHSPATLRRLTERAVSLNQGNPEAALRELRAQVAATLSDRLREAALPIFALLATTPTGQRASELGAEAAQAVRTQLLEEIEQACDALHDRTTAKRELPLEDEWREWAALRARYHRVCRLGGLTIRRLAWAPLHREACNWAVWLWNERHHKVLANAVFRFLLQEAEELQDESRITLARKNVGCGSGI